MKERRIRGVRWGLAALSLLGACVSGSDDAGSRGRHAVGTEGRDLRVVASPFPYTLYAGTQWALVFNVENVSDREAEFTLHDTPGAGFVVREIGCVSAEGVTCRTLAPTLAELGAIRLAPGATASLGLVFDVAATARPPAVTWDVRATLVGGEVDDDPTNDTARFVAPVAVSADLDVRFEATPPRVESGGRVSWTVSANNAGPSEALAEVWVVPAPTAFRNVTWACTAGPGSQCLRASGSGAPIEDARINSGASVRFVVWADVAPDFVGEATTLARVNIHRENNAEEGYGDPATDNNEATHTSTVVPAPPSLSCSGARPSVASLWPPKGDLVPIQVLGLEGAAIRVRSVHQDDASPTADATMDAGGGASVRARRLGTGDGRVYHIAFEATRDGARCESVVQVCVPHNVGARCVDGGPRYDATRPSAGH